MKELNAGWPDGSGKDIRPPAVGPVKVGGKAIGVGSSINEAVGM